MNSPVSLTEMKSPSTRPQNPIKAFFERDLVKKKLSELVGKNASSFATSVLQIAQSNDLLSKATPESIFSSACMAATLNLPINANLGFAHIVPYNNKKTGKVEAQFQIGWKGFVQLAQRSGQFRRISTAIVHEGQLLKSDPLTGYEFDWDVISEKVIGYVAYFQLLNGFEAHLYMSMSEVTSHAKKYSQSFKKGYGNWVENFDAMALKTVLKLLLSKYAPLSTDTQKAIESDQSVIRDIDGEFDYVDNQSVEREGNIVDVETGEVNNSDGQPWEPSAEERERIREREMAEANGQPRARRERATTGGME